jgi:hypothetical protein
MHTQQAAELSHVIHQNVEALKRLCDGLDDDTAAREPEGRWSPKEIVSHLCGPEGAGYVPTISAFIEQDTPRLDIHAEDPFFSDRRARMTFAELLEEMDREYADLARVVETLSEEQLGRTAHIPLLRDTPLGEYPTLAGWVRALGQHHLGVHVDHLREILQALGVRRETESQ